MLAKKHSCYFQLGGSDQHGNIQSGSDYISSQEKHFSAGLCFPLLTDKNGCKLGKSTMATVSKTSASSLWLDEKKTSPYAFYQFFKQLHDDVAEKFLLYMSQRRLDEIEAIIQEHRQNLGKWVAQTYLADEMTKLVHGRSGFEMASTCSDILFRGCLEDLEKLNSETISSLFGPASTLVIPKGSVKRVGELADLTKVFNPSQKGSTVMVAGGFSINGKEMKNPNEHFKVDQFLIKGQFTVIRWGRRKYSLVQWA